MPRLRHVWTLYAAHFSRAISTALSHLMKDAFDVKALRAFRVLRPLRLVSGVPSKSSIASAKKIYTQKRNHQTR